MRTSSWIFGCLLICSCGRPSFAPRKTVNVQPASAPPRQFAGASGEIDANRVSIDPLALRLPCTWPSLAAAVRFGEVNSGTVFSEWSTGLTLMLTGKQVPAVFGGKAVSADRVSVSFTITEGLSMALQVLATEEVGESGCTVLSLERTI